MDWYAELAPGGAPQAHFAGGPGREALCGHRMGGLAWAAAGSVARCKVCTRLRWGLQREKQRRLPERRETATSPSDTPPQRKVPPPPARESIEEAKQRYFAQGGHVTHGPAVQGRTFRRRFTALPKSHLTEIS